MAEVKVFFDRAAGSVKPMHATNNGPVVRRSDVEAGTLHPFNNNLEPFREAGIPYGRTHDSSFYHRYGMEHTVDVYYVFPNFDADPTDPKNYDFTCTDQYLEGFALSGTEVFYRLGHRIENEIKKYGTRMPRDFKKWAEICEHIIRHYNEGWADGYRMNITYWEIWAEPDLSNNLAPDKCPTWSGTKQEFFEFYHTVATHLKSLFPSIKVGGPSLAFDLGWAEEFFAQMKAPLDFFSWHGYASLTEDMTEKAKKVRELLDRYGLHETENILNEWSYLRGWDCENMVYSHRHRGKIKGASFSLAAMCACQDAPVDMLMYYDARPNEFWNGMFDDTVVGEVLKGYYPFYMFNKLYRLGDAVDCEGGEDIYLSAAQKGGEATVVFTHYNDNDETEAKDVTVSFNGFGCDAGTDVSFYLLNDEKDLSLVGQATYYGEKFAITLSVPNYTCYLVRFTKRA